MSRATSAGSGWAGVALAVAERDLEDLRRADGVAYEVPTGPPKESPGLLGKAKDLLLGGPKGREPQMWLLVDGQPMVDHDIKKQNLPPRTFA